MKSAALQKTNQTSSWLWAGFFTATFVILTIVVWLGWANQLDHRILITIARVRSPELTNVMLLITSGGSPSVITVAALGILLWFGARPRRGLWILATLAGSAVLNELFKAIVARPRPGIGIITETGYSFPSGHAMESLVVYGLLAYLLTRNIPRRFTPVAIWAVCGLLILAIGFSRLYLGVHYPSDVMGGYLAGVAILLIAMNLRGPKDGF